MEYDKKLFDFCQRTGYPIIQTNGQRAYGPPSVLQNFTPPKGSEIFVGNIPRDIFEDELVPIFESVGIIYRLRLMLDYSGLNRGFCFVTYTNPESANRAVNHLNNYLIQKHHRIGVNISIDNCRLFMGNIPSTIAPANIKSDINRCVNGVVDIKMCPLRVIKDKNKAHVFVTFEDHRHAALARRELSKVNFLWRSKVVVDWAYPEITTNHSIIEQIKTLYIKNWNPILTNWDVRNRLSEYIPVEYIVDIYKAHDYSFVKFSSEKIAKVAYEILGGLFFDGQQIQVSWDNCKPTLFSDGPFTNNLCKSVPSKLRRLIYLKREQLFTENSKSYGNKAFYNN